MVVVKGTTDPRELMFARDDTREELNGSKEKRKEIGGAEVFEQEIQQQEEEQFQPFVIDAQFECTVATFHRLEKEIEFAAQVRAEGATGGTDRDASPEEGRTQEPETGDCHWVVEGAPGRREGPCTEEGCVT